MFVWGEKKQQTNIQVKFVGSNKLYFLGDLRSAYKEQHWPNDDNDDQYFPSLLVAVQIRKILRCI